MLDLQKNPPELTLGNKHCLTDASRESAVTSKKIKTNDEQPDPNDVVESTNGTIWL